MFNFKSILVLALTSGVCAGAFADRPWPNKVCDCQVVTTSGAQGLVGIQTFSLDDAKTEVIGLTAMTLLGAHEPADRVIQCVEERSGDTFSDSSFQAWLDDMDK